MYIYKIIIVNTDGSETIDYVVAQGKETFVETRERANKYLQDIKEAETTVTATMTRRLTPGI